MQRPVDGDVDLRLAVVGELDDRHAADRRAADQDLVSLDELAARLEQQAVVANWLPPERSRTRIAIATSARAPIAARRANPPPPPRTTCDLPGEVAPSLAISVRPGP